MTARVSILLKSRVSLTCLRAYFLPGRAKDLSAPRHLITVHANWIRLVSAFASIECYESFYSPSEVQVILHHLANKIFDKITIHGTNVKIL